MVVAAAAVVVAKVAAAVTAAAVAVVDTAAVAAVRATKHSIRSPVDWIQKNSVF
jgi:hypothetical protein